MLRRSALRPVAIACAAILTVTAPSPLAAQDMPRLLNIGAAMTALPPLDLSQMRLWDYSKPWLASQWSNALSPIPWRYDHIVVRSDGAVSFFLDATGAPELQAVNGTVAQTSGLWEVDATLPQLRDGLVVAPLWLYNPQTRDEIDFEFAGRKGLDVTMHAYPGGVHRKASYRLFAGQDLSGRHMRFGIALDPSRGRIAMLVDGTPLYTFDKVQAGFFVSSALKPLIEMWAANPNSTDLVNWVGQWSSLPTGTRLEMKVHGYRYSK